MLSIGEFSRVTNLTVKSLRYYHDMEILIPEKIDSINGYRYYGEKAFLRADQISILKSLGFTINEIRTILEQCNSDEELSLFIENKINAVDKQIKDLQGLKKKLKYYNSVNETTEDSYSDIIEGQWGEFWYCSIRFTGEYAEIGNQYKTLYKNCGSKVNGKPMALYYDMEHEENNADIEALLPVTGELKVKDISCRYMAGKSSVSLIHKGPYGSQGPSYLKLFNYCKQRGYSIDTPIIEKYVRGPGFLFRGNEDKYLTELRVLIK